MLLIVVWTIDDDESEDGDDDDDDDTSHDLRCTLPPLNLQCTSTLSSYGLIKFCFFLNAFVQNH